MKSAKAAHLSSDVVGSSTTPINRVQGSSSTTRMGPFEVIDRRCPRRISAEPDPWSAPHIYPRGYAPFVAWLPALDLIKKVGAPYGNSLTQAQLRCPSQ